MHYGYKFVSRECVPEALRCPAYSGTISRPDSAAGAPPVLVRMMRICHAYYDQNRPHALRQTLELADPDMKESDLLRSVFQTLVRMEVDAGGASLSDLQSGTISRPDSAAGAPPASDRKSTRLNSSHVR